MRRVAAAAAILLVMTLPTSVAAQDIPEAAIREFLDGVAHADIEVVLEATAVDEMAEGFRFDQYTDRISSFQPYFTGPVHAPFFADIQRLDWAAELLQQTRMLTYSLLAPDTLGEALAGAPLTGVDAPWATDLMDELDELRLSSLIVEDIGLPEPELYRSDRNLELNTRTAGMYGADEKTERVVLLEFEGDTYAVGFQLLRYGDDWKVMAQSSPLSGLDSTGAARPMSRSEFSSLISE